jgi:hypothetical protein
MPVALRDACPKKESVKWTIRGPLGSAKKRPAEFSAGVPHHDKKISKNLLNLQIDSQA